MSVAIGNRLKPWKVMDPRACMDEADKYLFKQGGSYVSYRTITASSSSNSSVQWQCNPPSTSQIVSRLVYVTCKFNVEIVASSVTDAQDATRVDPNIHDKISGASDQNYICLRQFPIAAITDVCKININGTTIDNSPKKWIAAMSRYNLNLDGRNVSLSSSPAQPDHYQDYFEASAGGGGKHGTFRSPFLAYGDNTTEVTRGCFTPDSPPVQVGDKTTFSYTITEPLFISPLTSDSYSEKALGQVSEMSVQLNWDSKINRILSIDKKTLVEILYPGNANDADVAARRAGFIFNIKVDLAESSNNKISFTYITPQATRPIPPQCTYDYHNLHVRDKNIGTIVTNAEKEIYSDNHTINTIPSKIYLFLRQKESERTEFSSDGFARIKKISMNFNGQDSLLNGAEEWDIWRMSVDNGLKLSLIEWQKHTGSVCCIDFGKNIGVGVNQCVGMLGNFDIQFKLTVQNISSLDRDFDLYVLYDIAGILTLSASTALPQMGIVTPSDVLQAEDYKEMSAEYLERIYGGSFMTGMKNLYSKALTLKPYAKKAIEYGKMLDPVVGTIAPRLSPIYNEALSYADHLIGNGYTKKDIEKMRVQGWTDKDFKRLLKGGNGVGGNSVGGNMVGGKCIPKSRLRQRIKN